MARIDVERRPARTWLWWVVGLVVLAVVLFTLMRGRNADMETSPAGADRSVPATLATART